MKLTAIIVAGFCILATMTAVTKGMPFEEDGLNDVQQEEQTAAAADDDAAAADEDGDPPYPEDIVLDCESETDSDSDSCLDEYHYPGLTSDEIKEKKQEIEDVRKAEANAEREAAKAEKKAQKAAGKAKKAAAKAKKKAAKAKKEEKEREKMRKKAIKMGLISEEPAVKQADQAADAEAPPGTDPEQPALDNAETAEGNSPQGGPLPQGGPSPGGETSPKGGTSPDGQEANVIAGSDPDDSVVVTGPPNMPCGMSPCSCGMAPCFCGGGDPGGDGGRFLTFYQTIMIGHSIATENT